MRESIFGVCDVLFSPNVLSALKASIVKKRILGFKIIHHTENLIIYNSSV